MDDLRNILGSTALIRVGIGCIGELGTEVDAAEEFHGSR